MAVTREVTLEAADSLAWARKEVLLEFDTFVLFAAASTKAELVRVVAPKCREPTFS